MNHRQPCCWVALVGITWGTKKGTNKYTCLSVISGCGFEFEDLSTKSYFLLNFFRTTYFRYNAFPALFTSDRHFHYKWTYCLCLLCVCADFCLTKHFLYVALVRFSFPSLAHSPQMSLAWFSAKLLTHYSCI